MPQIHDTVSFEDFNVLAHIFPKDRYIWVIYSIQNIIFPLQIKKSLKYVQFLPPQRTSQIIGCHPLIQESVFLRKLGTASLRTMMWKILYPLNSIRNRIAISEDISRQQNVLQCDFLPGNVLLV